jgi:hypothetical protein
MAKEGLADKGVVGWQRGGWMAKGWLDGKRWFDDNGNAAFPPAPLAVVLNFS